MIDDSSRWQFDLDAVTGRNLQQLFDLIQMKTVERRQCYERGLEDRDVRNCHSMIVGRHSAKIVRRVARSNGTSSG